MPSAYPDRRPSCIRGCAMVRVVRRSYGNARARVFMLAGVLILAAVAAGIALHGDGPAPGVSYVATPPSGDSGAAVPDPFAYAPDREDDMVRRAAAGTSHVLYARSPGGATATAERVARWRPQVEAAARTARVDPDLLEG